MPPAVMAVAAAVIAGGGAALAGATLTAVIIVGVATLGLGLASQALAPKPKKPRFRSLTDEAAGRTVMIRSSSEPHKIIYGEVVVSGPLVFAATTGDKNEYLHMVVALAGHEVDTIGDVWLNDTLSDDARFSGLVRVNKHLGADNQVADSDLVAEVAEWTDAHRLRGIAYVYVRLKWDQDVWVTGTPNIKAKTKGRKVYDPRSSTTYWTQNATLCQRDYLMASFGIGAVSAEVDNTAVIAAANICDENVALGAGGTQDRYTCDGVISLAEKPIDIMEDLLLASVGTLVYPQGKYTLYAGAYTTPTVTLVEDDLRADLTLYSKPSRRDLFNAVRGVFVDADNFYQPTDFPPVTNSTYETEDDGTRIYQDIELPFTINSIRAQRIGKIHLERARQAITVVFPAKLTALELAGWDTVMLTIDRLGWSSKVFRILEWALSEDGGVDLRLQEEASTAYDWSTGDETIVDPAPNTNLPDPWTVSPPGAPQIEEELYTTSPGAGIKTRAIVTWTASPDQFVKAYQLEYKLSSDSTWIVRSPVRVAEDRIHDMKPGLYDFRVKAINVLDVASAYSTSANREISGLAAPPTQVTGLSLTVTGGQAYLTWDEHPDLDVRIGGKFRFRHSPATSGATWQGATDIAPAIPGSATTALIPLMPGTYLAKAVDSSGNASASATSVSTTRPEILALEQVTSVQEDPTFPGTKTNVVVQGNNLRLVSGQTSGQYDFSNTIDLGAVFVSRLRALVSALAFDDSSLIDDRTALIDTWEDIDGGEVSDADVDLSVRYTSDDPAGAPSWSSWGKFAVADYEARAFEFKVDFFTDDVAHSIQVDQLRVLVDMLRRTESAYDVTVGVSGISVTYNFPFWDIPALAIIGKDLATGDYVVVTSETDIGYDVIFKNSGGSGVSRKANWVAEGTGKEV